MTDRIGGSVSPTSRIGVGKEAKSLISNECRCESLLYMVVARSAE